jgi:hypothetical protein
MTSREYCIEFVEALAKEHMFEDGLLTKSHMYRSIKAIADANVEEYGSPKMDIEQFKTAFSNAFALALQETILKWLDAIENPDFLSDLGFGLN